MDYLKRFWQRLLDLPSHLSTKERRSLLALLIVVLIFGGYKTNQFINNRLVTVPTSGGTLVEAIVGHPKLLSILSASETVDQTILAPIYDGLTYTTADGETHAALAENWEITDDNKTYHFTLREGLKWHDGQPITTSDVAETIKRVLDDQIKSPYQEDWLNVTIEIVDPINIKFHLEEPAAGFLNATNLPITPLHIPVNEIQNSLVGSGAYKYTDSVVENNQIKEIILSRNDDWYNDLPYIDQLIFRFFDDEIQAVTAYQKNQADSLVLPNDNNLSGKRYDLITKRQRDIFLNTKREQLSDINNRRKVLNNENSPEAINLKLITHNSLVGSQKLNDQITSWQANNIQVEVVSLDSMALLAAIDSHDYDLLYVDVDMKADLDRYPLWHSSQINNGGLNFAQLDDSALDKLLEEAHTTTDLSARRSITDKVENRLQELAVLKVMEQVHLYWFVKDSVLGIEQPEDIINSTDRFFNLNQWYVKTKQRTYKSILNEQSLPEETQTDSVETISS